MCLFGKQRNRLHECQEWNLSAVTAQSRQLPYSLHGSDSMWSIFVNDLSWEIFYSQRWGNIQSHFWFVFQMFCEEIKPSLHHYLSVKNVSISSHRIYLPVAESLRRAQPRSCIHPLTQPHRWLILDGSIFPPSSLSVMISQGWRYRKWLYLTSLHTRIHTDSSFLVGNVSQSAVSRLWLPVSRRCFPWQGR